MELFRLLILAKDTDPVKSLQRGLNAAGFPCAVSADAEDIWQGEEPVDLLLVEVAGEFRGEELRELIRRVKQERPIPIILLVSKDNLSAADQNVDDFALSPYDAKEISLRAKRLLEKERYKDESAEYIKAGDLAIDLAKCEVTVSGKPVDLTFKEYELVKFLMSRKGRVLTREVLLNEIWGYDYFGGDRTVDVHIRRLRSKIEDPDHTFIETVRNIGYRLKAE